MNLGEKKALLKRLCMGSGWFLCLSKWIFFKKKLPGIHRLSLIVMFGIKQRQSSYCGGYVNSCKQFPSRGINLLWMAIKLHWLSVSPKFPFDLIISSSSSSSVPLLSWPPGPEYNYTHNNSICIWRCGLQPTIKCLKLSRAHKMGSRCNRPS